MSPGSVGDGEPRVSFLLLCFSLAQLGGESGEERVGPEGEMEQAFIYQECVCRPTDSPHLYNAGKEGLLQSIGTWGFRDLLMLPDLVTQLGCEFRTS